MRLKNLIFGCAAAWLPAALAGAPAGQAATPAAAVNSGAVHTQYEDNIAPEEAEDRFIALLPQIRGWDPGRYTMFDYDFAAASGALYALRLGGGGLRLDLPISASWVTSFDGELFGLNGIAGGFAGGQSFGVAGAQRISLGLDDAFGARLHFIGTLSWQHSSYFGSRPSLVDFTYMPHQPISTGAFGGSIGIAYRFY